MKFASLLSFILRSAAYGVLIAIVLLVVMPELRFGSDLAYNLFDSKGENRPVLSYASAVNKAAPSVVNIYSRSFETSPQYGARQLEAVRLGSGVIMDNQGHILTADHVIAKADQILVVLQNGEGFIANIIGRDSITDLAVLKVDGQNLPVIPQNEALETLVGDVVLAIGNPHNLGQTITQGIVSAVGRNGLSTTNYRYFLQTDAAINRGNSGGALVNSNGELVGISSASYSEIAQDENIQGIFFAIPYKLATRVMKELIENGRIVRGWLGIDAEQRTTNDKGFIITAVFPRTPAHQAGLLPGDFVQKINNIAMRSITQALDLVAETKPGTELTFEIIRNNQPMTIQVVIGELPLIDN